jgi:hypothetical protein
MYDAMMEAEATFNATGTLESLKALEVAEAAYFDALAVASARWNALPDGDRKYDAEINANDTREEAGFTRGDELSWFLCAIATYELCE